MAQLLNPFNYLAAGTVEDAIQMLAHHDGARVLAGGTDLLVSMKRHRADPRYVVYIKEIPGLDYIQQDRDGLRIGALTTHQAIAESPLVRERFGLMAAACNKVGTPQIRNMGTIGGNLCMAGPSQDTPPPLLALDARLKLAGPRGERTLPLDQFFTGPFRTAIEKDELLTEIRVPALPPMTAGCYLWRSKITAVDETLVGVAVVMTGDPSKRSCQEVRIALGSVAPTPMRARQAEAVLRGKQMDDSLIAEAARLATAEIRPRSRADYRRRMAGLLVEQAVKQCWQQIALEKVR